MLLGGTPILRRPQAHCCVQIVVGPAKAARLKPDHVTQSSAQGVLLLVLERFRRRI